MVKTNCFQCKKDIKKYPSQIKRYKKQFCSRECKHEWNKTVDGPWKGKKMPFIKRPNRDVSGSKNPRWKGGKRIDKDGYVLIWKPDHPKADYHGYVREHRLVMEESLGRILRLKEIVHHIDKNKQNNKLENLKLYESASKHQKEHYSSGDAKHIKNSPGWKASQKV